MAFLSYSVQMNNRVKLMMMMMMMMLLLLLLLLVFSLSLHTHTVKELLSLSLRHIQDTKMKKI